MFVVRVLMGKEGRVPDIVKRSYDDLPFLSDGRINYSDAERVPTVAVFLKFGNKILVLKRSKEVSNYQGRWSVITGYLDEIEPLIEKAFEEVEEETGVDIDEVSSVDVADPIEVEDDDRVWVTFPVLMKLRSEPEVELNWESVDYRWIRVDEIDDFISSSFLRCLDCLIDF